MTKDNFKIFNGLVLCIILLGLASAVKNIHLGFPIFYKKPVETPVPTPAKLTYVPQFVLISFDGSKAIPIWKDIEIFKNEMKAAGKPINMTHFINAAYFLTNETKYSYQGPGHLAGTSNIGFSDGIEDVRARIGEVNKAVADGDEIAPHTVGHFSGKGWTREEWKNELDSFYRIMFGLDQMYPNANLPKLNLKASDIIGFRAPYLDISYGLFDALHDFKYRYDTSEVGAGDKWPHKDEQGMWRIPLGTLFVGPNQVPVLAMDYNLYEHDTHASSLLVKGTDAWNVVYLNTLNAWLSYFNKNYSSNRAPVLVGYHFSMDWNNGAYWEAMKEFARQVCGQPQVRCGTFKELVNYLDEYGLPQA